VLLNRVFLSHLSWLKHLDTPFLLTWFGGQLPKKSTTILVQKILKKNTKNRTFYISVYISKKKHVKNQHVLFILVPPKVTKSSTRAERQELLTVGDAEEGCGHARTQELAQKQGL
jgi:hypothetical protein